MIEPDLDAGVRSVEAAVPTPYGELAVAWEREGGTASIRVEVPHGVSARLVLPEEVRDLPPGRSTHELRVARAGSRIDQTDAQHAKSALP